MEDDIQYDPPEPRVRRRLERPSRADEEQETNGFWGVLTTQAILCVIAVIFLVVTQTFFPALYEQSRQTYQKAATAPEEIPKELAEFANAVVSFFTDTPAQGAPDSETVSGQDSSQAASSEEQGASSAASSQASSDEAASQGASSAPTSSLAQGSSQAPVSSGAAASSVQNTTGIVKTSAGGGDAYSSQASAAPDGDTPLYPPANATFSPVVFTVRPGLPIQSARRTSGFGYRISPITGALEFHKALDLAAPEGTPVYAAVSGTVTASTYSKSLGYYIAIQHQNGFVTRYGHCSELIAVKGAVVRQGEVIAKVGATGEATGNHLHFEMSRNGIVFDPAWLYNYD